MHRVDFGVPCAEATLVEVGWRGELGDRGIAVAVADGRGRHRAERDTQGVAVVGGGLVVGGLAAGLRGSAGGRVVEAWWREVAAASTALSVTRLVNGGKKTWSTRNVLGQTRPVGS